VAVNVVVTVDVDNDGVEAGERTSLAWASIEWLPPLKEIFERLDVCVTWFVRADNQLMDVYGTAAHLLLAHEALWSRVVGAEDELGWHPHVYRWCEQTRRYVPERDSARFVDQLNAAHSDLASQGYGFASVRIGEAYHCNATMQAVEDLGLRVDSTAIPGRKRDDGSRVLDWSPTPNRPYHPSRADYRVAGTTDRRELLEVPMTTVPIKAAYDSGEVHRYLNPSFHNRIFRGAIERHLADMEALRTREHVVTLILHSGEVMPRERAHSLYAFSLDEVHRNIAYLLARLDEVGVEHRALRMRDVRESVT
jgi:hypothetical protein